MADANYFKGNHAIKLGFTWRRTQVHSTSEWPGNDIITMHDGYPNMIAQVTAPWATDGETKYMSVYAGDTLTLKRMTINAGVRFDHQSASVLPSVSDAVPGWENLLPKVTAPGISNALSYDLLQPRVGLTYSVDDPQDAAARDLRDVHVADRDDRGRLHVGRAVRWAYFPSVDLNGNKLADDNEIDRKTLIDYSGFDPANPSASTGTTYHRIGDYGVRSAAAILGMNREKFCNFGVSASFTWRTSPSSTGGRWSTARTRARCSTGTTTCRSGPRPATCRPASTGRRAARTTCQSTG